MNEKTSKALRDREGKLVNIFIACEDYRFGAFTEAMYIEDRLVNPKRHLFIEKLAVYAGGKKQFEGWSSYGNLETNSGKIVLYHGGRGEIVIQSEHAQYDYVNKKWKERRK